MDYGQIKDRCQFLLDNNDSQADASFSAARIQQMINWTYRDLVVLMEHEGGRNWLATTRSVSWPASQITLQIPADIVQQNILEIRNITHGDPGDPVVMGLPSDHTRIHFKDRLTLQWGTEGPGSAQTLRFVFYAMPTELVQDTDVPALLPPLYHELLALTSAIFLLEIGDGQAPMPYKEREREMKDNLAKFVSKAKPNTDGPGIWYAEPDVDGWGVY